MFKIYISESQIKTNINDNFWKWFGTSVVKDNRNDPLILYKGMLTKNWRTGKDINVIDSVNGAWAGYFTDNEDVANGFRDIYGTMGDSKTFKVFLKLKNPYIVDAKSRPAKDFMLDANVLEKQSNIELTKILYDKTYDSIIIKNTKDEGTLYIPFKSNQIKSIQNDGSWDINDNNIYS